MSYIIKSTTPFASTKLTETGREKLAKGQLNFNTWSIGDSEINYEREFYLQNEIISGSTKVLRPKDKNPNLKYFISNSSGTNSFSFGAGDIRCVKATISNQATERGFFEGSFATGYTTTASSYVRTSGTSITIAGGTTFTLAGVEIGDFILVKVGYSDYTNSTPEAHLWFKAENVVGSTVTVDRELPNVGATNAVVVYKGGEISDNELDAIAYWDTGTLSFDASCTVTSSDVAPSFWNMNIPFSEDILGTSGTTLTGDESHINYGSYDLVGQKDNYLFSTSDAYRKSLAIIHYSNKSIANLYGEFIHIDGATKAVEVFLPDLLYHRRSFSGGTATGDAMGMTFVASGSSISVGSNGLRYVSLIEKDSLVDGTAQQVGRVYPDLKIIVFDDPEIVAAMSYKSNRNWTLPKLELALVNPSGGAGTGALAANSTMYVTYSVDNESGTGVTPALPCQYYATVTNSTSSTKDVQFNIETVDLLPYMRNDNTGDGFYGDTLKVIFQITTDGERPDPALWKELDYSSSVISGSFIDTGLLETQNPLSVTPNFQIKLAHVTSATTYSVVNTLTMPPVGSDTLLQFGDERFFYGNISTYIGATIFKSLFKISLNASDFTTTTNATRNNDPTTSPPNVKVSEVGIYDSDGDLVIISKLSQPVELASGKQAIIELSMDF